MGWATAHITRLLRGKTVSFRPRGHSMSPKIRSGSSAPWNRWIRPFFNLADIVLCRVRAAEYLHLIKAMQDGRFQIGNNRGHINGWIGPRSIFGRLTRVED